MEALLIVGFGVGLWLFTRYNAVSTLNFFPGSLADLGFQGTTPVGTFTLIVQNTSNVDLSVDSFAGNVYANDILIGNVSSFQRVQLLSNSLSEVPLNVRFFTIGIVNDVIRAFQTGSVKQDIVLEGSIGVSGVAVPIELTFKIGL